MTLRHFHTSSLEPFGFAESRFRFASGLLTLRLAMTVNSLARVSRRNARPRSTYPQMGSLAGTRSGIALLSGRARL